MNLEDALAMSATNIVLRRLEDDPYQINFFFTYKGKHIRKPSAKRPYFGGEISCIPGQTVLYEHCIVAYSTTDFYIADDNWASNDIIEILPASEIWQVLGKDDWEPM